MTLGIVMVIFGALDGIAGNAPARLSGDLLMVGSAWLYGGYMVISKRWMQRFGELRVICSTFAAGGILLTVVGVPQVLATEWAGITRGRWVGIAYVTLLAGFVGLVLWYRTIGRTSASGTAVYQYLVPGTSVVCATVFLGERIAALQLVGIAVTLVGVYLARVPPGPGADGVKGIDAGEGDAAQRAVDRPPDSVGAALDELCQVGVAAVIHVCDRSCPSYLAAV